MLEERKFLHNILQVCKQCQSLNGKSGRRAFHRQQGGVWYTPHGHFPTGNRIQTDANTRWTLHKIEGNKNRYETMAWVTPMLWPDTVSLFKTPQHMATHIFSNARESCYVYLSPNVCKLCFKIMNYSMREIRTHFNLNNKSTLQIQQWR